MSARTSPSRSRSWRSPPCPIGCSGIYYINVASQILFFAVFALGLNVLVGYAGLVSLGHAGLFGISAYATGYMLQLGYGHTRGDPGRAGHRHGLDGGLCRAVAARDRHRLHHDHAGAGRNPVGPRLSLDQPDRRRQRHQRADAAGAVRLFADGADHVLLHDADHFPGLGRRWWRSSCARRSAPR